uniref:Leucine-rich repeat domain-containing protein n=1 Tax=viral metagenome TaxID=1070528 RepID=A0A6C0E7I1_9ZZZZ
MGDSRYDPNTTYLIFTPEYAFYGYDTVEDINSNVYNLDNNFPYNSNTNPYYTYSNNSENLNISFYWMNPLIQDPENQEPPGLPFNNYFEKVILGKNVTTIIENAFQACEQLQYITIPDSVLSIGDSAFSDCNLNSVTIPDTVTSISEFAFYGNYNLTTISIGNSVSSIGDDAFMYIARNSPNNVTLNWGSNEYVANYFYTNITNNGYNNSYTVNITYNPPYTPTLPSPTTTVAATYTVTSSGRDLAGNVVTGSSTFSATASGNSKNDAIKSSHTHANDIFVLPTVSDFSSKYTNVTHTITYSHP